MEDSVYARISIKVPQKVTFFLNDHVNKGPFDLKPAIDLRKCFMWKLYFQFFSAKCFLLWSAKLLWKSQGNFDNLFSHRLFTQEAFILLDIPSKMLAPAEIRWKSEKNVTNATYTYMKMMMKMMNCFCGMIDQWKLFTIYFSQDHCQRFPPPQIFNTLQGEFEHALNLSSDFVDLSCVVVVTITPWRQVKGLPES